ncbi:MAG: argininosuccinate lyase, partial [Candidatus Bathyarchaeia archaeon]
MSELLRGGRLSGFKREIIEFTSSIKHDTRIIKHIVSINKAHSIMLMENRIIRAEEGSKILGALIDLENKLILRPDIEDA